MLAGVLGVLKIIGIALLVILALILVLLLLVLFVPIRYRAKLYIPETELDNGFDVEKIEFSGRFSWLLHILSGGIDFPKDKEFFVKLFGLKILPGKDKNKDEDNNKDKKPDADKKSKKINKDDNKESQSEEPAQAESGIIEMSDMKELEDKGEETQNSEESAAAEEISENTSAEEDFGEEEKEDRALIEIIQDILDKVENILKTPQNVLEKLEYTISRLCDKIKMIKTTLESDIFKRAFSLVKGKLIKIIRMILPDKYKAELLLGVGDPATTAELTGAYGMLYPIFMDNIVFEPDFQHKIVMVRADIKGHVTVFTILYSVLVCYFNKDVKKVIRRFKKIMNS